MKYKRHSVHELVLTKRSESENNANKEMFLKMISSLLINVKEEPNETESDRQLK